MFIVCLAGDLHAGWMNGWKKEDERLTMISMALSKLLMAFTNLLAFMLLFPSRINKGATGFTRVARSRTSMAWKSNKYLSENTTTLLGNLICRPGKATIVDNSLWDTYAMQQIIGILQLKFEKKHCCPVINVLLSPPHPIQC